MRRVLAAVVLLAGGVTHGFVLPLGAKPHATARRVPVAHVVPLELEGQLDPAKTWDVKMTFEGETRMVTVSEGTSILEAAEKEWDVPFSCRNGICTTCSARVLAGAESKKEAIHGLSGDQSKQGFILTCQTHPVGPGLELLLGQYDTVYEMQYGQYEKQATTERKGTSIFG